MIPFALRLRWLGTALLFCFGIDCSAQLEDVSLDFLMESSTFGSLFGCGLSTVDFNGDGWDDVTLAGVDGLIKLYTGGDEGLTFQMEIDLVNEAKAVLWVDIENDGDLDLFAGARGLGVYLFVRQPDGSLIEEGVLRGIPLLNGWDNRGISARDYDRDGDLDIYIASYHDTFLQVSYQNKFFQNTGQGFFEEITLSAFVGDGFQHSFQGAWYDYDNNGFDDLWVINDREDFTNSLYANGGGGPFVDISESSGASISVNAMSATLFDPDNDGDWDQYVTNTEDNPNAFMLNNDGFYQDIAASAGVAGMQYGWGTCAIDVDGDRWDDMMVATYRFPNAIPYDNHLYMNDGTGLVFEETTEDWPNEQFQLYCLGRLDLDQDRVPDIVGHGNALSPQVLKLTNEADNHRMTIDLVGTVSNTRGIGAVIKVHADSLTQMKQVNAGEDYMTQHTYTRFIGLGDVEVVDSIEVVWPSGIRDVLFDLAPDSDLLIVEGVGADSLVLNETLCPWEEASWKVPFDPASVSMTWNGVPVYSNVVVADAPGEWTLDVSWWGGGYTWSQTVNWAPEAPPQYSLDVLQPPCFGDSALVSWSLPENAVVTLDSVPFPPTSELFPCAVGPHELQVTLAGGCAIDSMFTVYYPEDLYAEVELMQPQCAGDFGAADIAIGGGTGGLTLDVEGVDLTALEPGVSQFHVVDSMGCVLSDSLVVIAPDSLVGSTGFEYLGSSDSAIVVTFAEGGTPPYVWSWSGPIDADGLVLAPVNLGWYVQDFNGCLDLGVFSIGSNPMASVSNAQQEIMWTCSRQGGLIILDGPEGRQLNVSVYELSGKMIIENVQVLASTHLALRTSGAVVVTGVDASGELFRWLR